MSKVKRLRCLWCRDWIEADPQALREKYGLSEASLAGFVTRHNDRKHALVQAELALQRGDLAHALRIALWLMRPTVPDAPVWSATYEAIEEVS